LTRPLAIVGPLVCTLPVIVLFTKFGPRMDQTVQEAAAGPMTAGQPEDPPHHLRGATADGPPMS
jgi:hypothetical protein